MGKYETYLSDKYPTEEDIAELLEELGDAIDKYKPGLDLDDKVKMAKYIAYTGRKRWVDDQQLRKRVRKLRQLGRTLKESPGPKNLAKYVAYKARYALDDIVFDVLPDMNTALRTFSDVNKVTKNRERAEAREAVGKHLEGQQGVWEHGRGPEVFAREGTFGQPIVIVKKGVDLTPSGLLDATRNGHRIHCFSVTDRGISVVKKRGSLRRWFDDHASHYLVRVENGDISDFTGQKREWAEIDKMLDSPWPPLADLNTIGVTVQVWKGLYIEEDQYEVIDPLMKVAQHFTERGGGITATGVEAILKAPNELAEIFRSAKELVEPVKDQVEGLLKLIKKEEAKDNLAAVQVTFTPTTGTPLECRDSNTSRFVVNGQPARGLKIGDIAGEVLALAGVS